MKHHPRFLRFALSFFSIAIGWLIPNILLMFYQILRSGYHSDTLAMMFWTGYFAIMGWVIFVVPLILWNKTHEWLMKSRILWVYGILYGLLIFHILALVLFPYGASPGYFKVLAATIGGICFFIYPILCRHKLSQNNHRPNRLASLILISPLILALSCHFIIWPITVAFCPIAAYRLGGTQTRANLRHRFIQEIQYGDKFSDLHRKMPDVFKKGTSHLSGFSGDGSSFRIRFKDGIASELWINEKQQF